jgi:large subunit ribosomal protein L1
MGKIRVKTFGDEASEQEDQKKLKEKREQKKLAKAPNLKGGEKIASVGPTEEELMAETSVESTSSEEEAPKKGQKAKFAALRAKTIGKKYKENSILVNKSIKYPLSNGIEILKKFKAGKFDETVELHINTKEKGLSGQIPLPHGSGKKLRIKVVDEALLAEVEKGKIDFDVLIASPSMMPQLARVAKILGPKGLMPNPKAGTITDKPDALIEKLSKGQVNYKTEATFPIIHLSVGKLSFGEKELTENIQTSIKTIGGAKINSVTLKSTMSPAIRLDLTKLA